MRRMAVVGEFWQFLRLEKKYWLVPIVTLLLLLAVLIVVTASSAIAPLIYTIF